MNLITKNCKCPSCNGTGFIKEFAHVAGGECFQCNGTGSIEWQEDKDSDFVEKKYTKQLKNGSAEFLFWASGYIQCMILDNTGESVASKGFDNDIQAARSYWRDLT